MKRNKMNVLFLSNMIAEKGVWTIVEVAKILHGKELPVEFHFVGNGVISPKRCLIVR